MKAPRPQISSEGARWAVSLLAPMMMGLVLLTVWEGGCRLAAMPVYLLPKPSDIALVLLTDGSHLVLALFVTLRIALSALVVAALIGTPLAILFVQSRWLERCLFPFAILFQVTPIVAIAPIIIILVKNTQLAILICASVMALFPIISNTVTGLRSVDRDLADYFTMNRAGAIKTLWRLKIPSALPYFLAGLRISSGLALIGAVVAEFIAGTGGRSAGLAYEILQAGFALDIPRMFTAVFLIGLSGIGIFLMMAALTRYLIGHWHESERSSITTVSS